MPDNENEPIPAEVIERWRIEQEERDEAERNSVLTDFTHQLWHMPAGVQVVLSILDKYEELTLTELHQIMVFDLVEELVGNDDMERDRAIASAAEFIDDKFLDLVGWLASGWVIQSTGQTVRISDAYVDAVKVYLASPWGDPR